MPLINKTATIENDAWTLVTDAGELSAEKPQIVTLEIWRQRKSELVSREGKVGLLLQPEDDVCEIEPDLDRWPIIAIDFPEPPEGLAFDGRGYSHARTLRDRFRYKGELRAVGKVLRDHLYYLNRVGFDTFQLPEGSDAESALRAFMEFSVRYQAAADNPQPLYRQQTRPSAG